MGILVKRFKKMEDRIDYFVNWSLPNYQFKYDYGLFEQTETGIMLQSTTQIMFHWKLPK